MFSVTCSGKLGMHCALCRQGCLVPEEYIKEVLAEHVPSHALTLENKCCDKKYVLSHLPCDGGGV